MAGRKRLHMALQGIFSVHSVHQCRHRATQKSNSQCKQPCCHSSAGHADGFHSLALLITVSSWSEHTVTAVRSVSRACMQPATAHPCVPPACNLTLATVSSSNLKVCSIMEDLLHFVARLAWTFMAAGSQLAHCLHFCPPIAQCRHLELLQGSPSGYCRSCLSYCCRMCRSTTLTYGLCIRGSTPSCLHGGKYHIPHLPGFQAIPGHI